MAGLRTIALALAGAVLACVASSLALAQNNGLPSRQQSVVLVESMALRGLECDLLRPWEGAALQTQSSREMAKFDAGAQAEIEAEIDRVTGEMACDSELLTVWIEGAHPGFEREMLPFFLTGYDALATLDPVPPYFIEQTGRSDFAAVLPAINREIARLEADGIRPEGGGEWDEYRAMIGEAARDIAAAMGGQEGLRFPPDEARGFASDIATVIELWLADQAQTEENE